MLILSTAFELVKRTLFQVGKNESIFINAQLILFQSQREFLLFCIFLLRCIPLADYCKKKKKRCIVVGQVFAFSLAVTNKWFPLLKAYMTSLFSFYIIQLVADKK